MGTEKALEYFNLAEAGLWFAIAFYSF